MFSMKKFNLWDTLLGWVAFAVSLTVYLMTIEPTASFWDCGEYIASAFKLEVGHPPGNPIFMLTGNLFTQFARNTSEVAMMVNVLSALMSALTILFLFWTVTRLARKVVDFSADGPTLAQAIVVLASGMVGALAYTFSDTFWFSAVEGEVYATSSLFTALVFWLILKWEDYANEPHGDRWLVLIAYLMGISIGVHLLNLLAIPSIVLVYYYKKYEHANLKGSIIALGVSFVIVALLMWGLIPGVVKVAGWFELFFVNSCSMPFNSGLFIYLIAVAASLIWGIYETVKDTSPLRMKLSLLLPIALMGIPFIGDGPWMGIVILIAMGILLFYTDIVSNRLANTVLVCMMVIMMGYSSYAVIVVRSSANTPMDQNSPEDIFALGSYLNREQYGDRPLVYGESYASPVLRDENCSPVVAEGAPIYARKVKRAEAEQDQYIVIDHKMKQEYESSFKMLFPRMYSRSQDHISAYKSWGNVTGRSIPFTQCGQTQNIEMPSFVENMRFFFSYQLNFMYWRYFLWNFSGRQNDIQGHGEIQNGNWISGIPFIDKLMIGDQSSIPAHWQANKGHNKFYLLPLILGVIGLLFQAYSGKKGIESFWVTFFLFFMTGIAIVIYLNQTPYQPRERDYAYAGSFYAYCIWIGLGVAGVAHWIQKAIRKPMLSAIIAAVIGVAIPIQMASQTWDDHDRSGRYTARDFGYNYLASCGKDAVIFTNGDNDTFPLWYNQEVEGERTDVRVCNLSYLQTDWYIDQMNRQAYDSQRLPISWTPAEYAQGTHDFAYVINRMNEPMELSMALSWVKSEDPRYKSIPGYGESIDYIPAEELYLLVDKQKVMSSGIVSPELYDQIADTIHISLKGKRYIGKHELMILDMLANNQWERPMYYAVTVSGDQYLNLKPYFVLEGLSYRIMPLKPHEGRVNTAVMFDNMVHKFRWGGLDSGKALYMDENNVRMCKTQRNMFCRLVETLIQEGKTDSAKVALDRCLEVIPATMIPHDYSSLSLAESYYQVGDKSKAQEILKQIERQNVSELAWYSQLKGRHLGLVGEDMRMNLAIIYQMIEICRPYDSQYADLLQKPFDQYRLFWEMTFAQAE